MHYKPNNIILFIQKSLLIILGTILVAASYYIFQKPNGITAPGLGGLAILLAGFMSLPLGLVYFGLNIPLFLIGYRAVGPIFALLSLIGMSSLSVFLGILDKLYECNYPLLGCIFSGLLSGIGIGLVLRAGGTTGGLDIASVVISRMSKRFTIGKTMIVVNGIVLFFSFVNNGLKHAILAFISMYLAGRVVDWMLSNTKQLMKGGVEI